MADTSATKQQNLPDWLRQLRDNDFPDEPDNPIVLEGPEEVMCGLVDNEEPLRIVLYDAEGAELVEVIGITDPPQRFKAENGEEFGDFKLRRHGVEVGVLIPLDPGTRCVIYPGGMTRGLLPSGTSWSIHSALPDPFAGSDD